MSYNFETDASSSRTEEVGGEEEGGMVEGAIVSCAFIPTTWDGWVKAGGAEGRKWRGSEAWLKVVGVWAAPMQSQSIFRGIYGAHKNTFLSFFFYLLYVRRLAMQLLDFPSLLLVALLLRGLYQDLRIYCDPSP